MYHTTVTMSMSTKEKKWNIKVIHHFFFKAKNAKTLEIVVLVLDVGQCL